MESFCIIRSYLTKEICDSDFSTFAKRLLEHSTLANPTMDGSTQSTTTKAMGAIPKTGRHPRIWLTMQRFQFIIPQTENCLIRRNLEYQNTLPNGNEWDQPTDWSSIAVLLCLESAIASPGRCQSD